MTVGDDRPRRLDGVSVRDRDGTPTLIGPTGERLARLNETALAVWDLCDGQTTVDEMVEAVVELSAVDRDRVRTDVDRTLIALDSVGALQ